MKTWMLIDILFINHFARSYCEKNVKARPGFSITLRRYIISVSLWLWWCFLVIIIMITITSVREKQRHKDISMWRKWHVFSHTLCVKWKLKTSINVVEFVQFILVSHQNACRHTVHCLVPGRVINMHYSHSEFTTK